MSRELVIIILVLLAFLAVGKPREREYRVRCPEINYDTTMHLIRADVAMIRDSLRRKRSRTCVVD